MTARIDIEITHADRVLFPADGITKGDLVDYYGEVAAVMLPHLKAGPLMLQRHPRGIGEQGFVQKDFADSLPDWMDRAEVAKAGGTVVHPLAEHRQSLEWLANQDCSTPHTWLSRQGRLDTPDRIVFDLDPSDNDFAAIRATAHTLAAVLKEIGLVPYVQTTGSRGLHVVASLRAEADFDTVRQFARDVAELVADDDAAHRTIEVRKEKRGDRIYLDIMRNAYAQTAVTPYAVRVRRGAPVATPLEWDELDSNDMRPDRFTLRDIPKRIAAQPDPWAHLNRHARSLTRPSRRLSRLRGDPS
ncbi:non-homologous end-joining DNA ligase [Nocardia vinacea]|uniref:Non-homologous end-joining DNA ligase n=1 Tax=Nocardia vinacea TaxID=96468 RepID=A0ABZ1YHQ5_9NOCA|nr:non-homologous end-joining DNA ligase [Nocardia vinacea]